MKQVAGIWLPDSDEHFSRHLEESPNYRGHATYQLSKIMKAMPLALTHFTAVDVGAHVGLWSMVLRHTFREVVAFEPIKEHIECFKKNLEGRDGVTLHEVALGERAGEVKMTPVADNSGNAHVTPRGRRKVEVKRLDDYTWQHMDFLKIDVEGYELDVIKGGKNAITTFRPIMVVEQKPGHAQRFGHGETEAVELLQSWGAKLAWTKAGDFCFTW